jgi:hypothetical protein
VAVVVVGIVEVEVVVAVVVALVVVVARAVVVVVVVLVAVAAVAVAVAAVAGVKNTFLWNVVERALPDAPKERQRGKLFVQQHSVISQKARIFVNPLWEPHISLDVFN